MIKNTLESFPRCQSEDKVHGFSVDFSFLITQKAHKIGVLWYNRDMEDIAYDDSKRR